MNTKDLKCFEAVYQEKSISRAARRLYITPQGLGKNIRTLEAELETVLFERTKQGMRPTQSADFLYGRTKKIIQELEELENGVRQLENRKIVLRIGCACGVFNVLPFELILNFMRENPHIRVEWNEYSNEEVKSMLEDSRLEYGFIVGKHEGDDMIQRKLDGKEILLLVFEGHPLYEKESVNVEMLREENMILMNEHFHMYHDFASICCAKGFTPNIIAKTSDGAVLYKLCRQKIGLAVIPEFMLEDFRMEHMRAIPFEEHMTWEVFGVYKEDTKNYETIQQFDCFLKQKVST